jgi:hypothetical protein
VLVPARVALLAVAVMLVLLVVVTPPRAPPLPHVLLEQQPAHDTAGGVQGQRMPCMSAAGAV